MTLYAWLLLGSFAGPFILSFDKKVAFYKLWMPLFAGILVNAVFFIAWDYWFTKNGVWGFNPQYVWHYRFMLLPLEEIAFFIVVPYCSIFIYACCKAYFKVSFIESKVSLINKIVLLALLLLMLFFHQHTYTFFNCLFAFIILALHQFVFKKNYFSYFWMAYIIHLIPFLLINGVLTSTPVVIYNPQEIIGLRIFSIPIEDTIYAFTCLLIPITVMESVRQLGK